MILISKLSAVIVFSIVMPVMAFANGHGHLEISHSWIKASLPGSKMTGGFVTITNKGMHEDHLIAAYSDIAKKTELHTMVMDDGVMKMRAVDGGWAIPVGATLELAPGGNHIMFIGLTGAVVEGGMQTITMEFKHAGKIEQVFMVKKAGDKKMQHGDDMTNTDC